MFYAKFNRHDNALQAAKELKIICENGSSFQRKSGFPYLVLMLSYSMAHNWFDVAEVVAETGKSILNKDHSLNDAGQNEQYNWTKDIARLENLTGKSFH